MDLKKSKFAENSDLIGATGYSFGYVETLSMRNPLKYPRHQNLCSPVIQLSIKSVWKQLVSTYWIIDQLNLLKYEIVITTK